MYGTPSGHGEMKTICAVEVYDTGERKFSPYSMSSKVFATSAHIC